MKIIITLFFFSFLLCCCDTEHTAIKSVPEDNLTENMALKSKLLQVVQSPTALDNVIDGSGCFAIAFPYTANVNGQVVSLDSEADYAQVRSILAVSESDVDMVVLQFPVTVRYADYTEAVVTTQAQFDSIINGCVASTELSCMSLTYPIGIKSYNSEYQLADSFTLGTKKGMFEFLNNLNAYDAVVLDYPIAFNAPDGTTLLIGNNQSLEQHIDTFTQDCMDALNPPDPLLQDVIAQGNWYVSSFFEISDQTSTYAGYDFTFGSSGTILVTGSNNSAGTWVISNAGSIQQVTFTFSAPQLDNLAQTWNVTNFTTTQLQLEIEATGVQPARSLSFSKY